MLIDRVSAPLFRFLSRVRGARVFHPRGAAYEATWRTAAGGPLGPAGSGASEGELQAVVRTSRGIGLPPPAPDLLGLAIKVLDAHGPGHDQDLLLASVGSGRFSSRVLRPTRSFSGTLFSSLFPYVIAGTRAPVVAVVHGEPSTSARATDDPTAVRVEVAVGRTGPVLATVILTRKLTAPVARDLCFDPWNTGRSMRPAGFLNRLRRPVYEASQSGRSAPPPGDRRRRGLPES